MTNTEESLLRCTSKKSWSVLWKVLKYGAYLIAGILAAVFAFYGARVIYELVVPGLASTWQFLIGVPWYYYAGSVGVAAIPVYSVLWCIARDLTEEDWKSDAANKFAFALAIAAIAVVAVLAFVALALAIAIDAIAAIAIAFAIAAIALDPVDHITIWYYIFRFPGAAYHHYHNKKED